MHPELIQYGRGALVVVHACLPPVFGISSPFMCVSVVVCSFHTPDQTSAADSTFSAAYMQAYDSYPSSRWSIRCSAVTFATSGVDFDLSAMFAFAVPSLFHFFTNKALEDAYIRGLPNSILQKVFAQVTLPKGLDAWKMVIRNLDHIH